MKNIGIWIRVSTEDQAKGESPQHHEERAKAYALMFGWELITVYHLEGVSGKSVKEHPEAVRMMEDVQSGRINGLIFSKLARLARSTKELLEFSEFFRNHNADLISLQEKIDTSTPAGRLFYTVIAAMAQWEREEIADRVSASIPIRAKLGKPLGGAAPYGYIWKDGKLELDPKESPVRKLIFEFFLQSKRRKHVAKKLNDLGYRTRNGSLFTDTTITRLLRDPIAKGLKRANYTKSLGEGKHWELKPEDSWVLTEAPAIVSKELWKDCNDILDTIAEKNKKPAKVVTHLFGGLTICHCGGKMYVSSHIPKYICKKCNNKMVASDLEEIFHDQLDALLSSEQEYEFFVSDYQKAIKERQEIKKSLPGEITILKNKLDTLLDLHSKKEIPTEGFSKHYSPLYEQLQQKERNLEQIEGEIDALTIQTESSNMVFDEAKILQKDWMNKNRDEKRMIIEDIVDAILIGTEDIEIRLKGLPRAPSLESIPKWQHNSRGSYSPQA